MKLIHFFEKIDDMDMGDVIKDFYKSDAKQFKGKDTAIELNITALGLGRDYFKDNLKKEDPYTVEPREIENPQFFIEGNEAVALGSHFGGVQMLAWYPITPSSSLAEGTARLEDDGVGVSRSI